MTKLRYPKNPSVSNAKIVTLYLYCLRKKWHILSKIIELLLNCEIACEVPDRLFIPHPSGIVAGRESELSNDVVLMQQVTLGCRRPYCNDIKEFGYPILKEGVYVGAGAKVMGRVIIGEWAIIGPNAVVTIDVPAYSVVVGYNKILSQKSTEF